MKLLKLFVIILPLLISSCASEMENIVKIDPLEEYIAFGRLHNKMLENTERVASELNTRSETFKAEDWKEIHKLQKEQVAYLNISNREKKVFIEQLDNHFEYYNVDSIWNVSFDVDPKDQLYEISRLISQLHEENIIDTYERVLLMKLSLYVISNKGNSNQEILPKIENLADEWRNFYEYPSIEYGQYSIRGGKFSAYILGICLSSAEWWQENSDSAAPETRVAPWVWADAMGALRSGLYTIIQQQIKTNLSGNIDWEQVAYSALAGGVITSTRGLKQIATLISTFFIN